MIFGRAQQRDGRPVLIIGLTPEDWEALQGREAAWASADLVGGDTGLDLGVALVAGINAVEITNTIIQAWRGNVDGST